MMVQKQTSLPCLIVVENSERNIVSVIVEVSEEPERPQELFRKPEVDGVIEESHYYWILT